MEFDAYHKWLGIPPHQQPPHHYRLLGVDPLEADQDVIDAAANQRIAYLQEVATGEQLAASQKLLNEVAQARRCLLNPEKKFLYDLELRKQLEQAAAPPIKEKAVPVYQRPLVLAVAGGGLLVLILAIAFLMGGGGGHEQSNRELASVVIDWPMDQREGARATIDGTVYEIPNTQPVQLDVPTGRYDLVLERTGYQPIRQSLTLLKGDIEKFRLNWRRAAP